VPERDSFPKVISASRRVDMVTGYRDELMEILAEAWPPERVHTVVIWTKNPPALAADSELLRFLSKYDQVFLHLTVTGLGGSVLEPLAPPWRSSLDALPKLVRFCGDPERVRFRFDPLIEVEVPGGGVVSNLDALEDVVGAAAERGVRNVSTSWVTSYAKVTSRLAARGIRIRPKTPEQVKALCDDVRARAEALGARVHFCCVPGLPRSRCIDGELLNRLHPAGKKCSTSRAANQRPLCGCTESFDIGWYKACPTGCLYCYANPAPVGDGRTAPASRGRGVRSARRSGGLDSAGGGQ